MCKIVEVFLSLNDWLLKIDKRSFPKLAEEVGMRILIKVVKGNLGLRRGKLLFGFEGKFLDGNSN